jgi:hypothetical protein
VILLIDSSLEFVAVLTSEELYSDNLTSFTVVETK